MASRNSFKIDGGDLSYRRRRYTITELLWMGKTLPYVCCPVKSFKPDAWTEKILISAIPAGKFIDTNEKLRAKILTARLELHRPHELISLKQKQEALNILAKRKSSIRGTPPKPCVMPTIPEVPSLPNTPNFAATGGLMQPISPSDGFSGGYGKKIESTTPKNNGLVASMHAFVPGGTLKTVPVTAIDSGDGSSWSVKGNSLTRKSSTLSLADGLGFSRAPIVATTNTTTIITVPTVTLTAAKKKLPVGTKVENARYSATAEDHIDKDKVELLKPLVERPKALMARRSTSNDQMAWIQFMMKKQITSASQKAPQAKEALGASIDDADDRKRFKALDDLHEGKISAHPSW